MNLIVVRYLLKQYLRRMALIAVTLSGVLLAFDLLGNIVTVTAGGGPVLQQVLVYSALRLPSIVALVIPISALLAALITLTKLAGGHEMTALSAAGVTVYRMGGILLLGTLLASTGQFILSNAVIPRTAPRLAAWGENDYHGPPPKQWVANMPLWLQTGPYLVHMLSASPDGQSLQGVTIVERDDAALLNNLITAKQAAFINGTWQLRNVIRQELNGSIRTELPTLDLDLPMRPDDIGIVAGSTAEMGLPTLWRVAHLQGVTARPAYVYSLWIQRKLAEPLESIIMVLLAVAFGLQLERRKTLLRSSLIVIGLGFSYYIAERILLSLGETGALPVVLAVWGPAAVFGLLGSWMMLNRQG